jgi:glycerol-3-phosphate dehydrogenase
MRNPLNANSQNFSAITKEHYDVIVIGAGVVGCAMTRRFTLQGAKVLLVEKASDILAGASKGNSAILHTGFDEVAGSIEHQCVTKGYQEFLEIHHKMNLPMLETGALIVAWNAEQDAKLESLLTTAHSNGVKDVERISAAKIRQIEPQLASSSTSALLVPGEHVIDPWTTPYCYLLQGIEQGATLLRNTQVLSGEYENSQWTLETNQGALSADTIVNCAGLYGDHVDQLLIKQSAFEIHPRKGQFLVYDKAASELINKIILPVPTKVTKGVVVCRTIFGNLLVGPTADEQESRDDTSVDSASLEKLKAQGEAILPALKHCPVTATYAGIRPATAQHDYAIKSYPEKSYISVGGIRSTGLSGALGIASYVYQAYQDMGYKHSEQSWYSWPAVNSIAQNGERDWQKANNGGIVCHCELVTKREVEQALSGPLAAKSLSALKRRTRVTMGRCQGFYCTAALSDITDEYFDEPLACDRGVN